MSLLQLKKENDELKEELIKSKQQINSYKKELNELRKQLKLLQTEKCDIKKQKKQISPKISNIPKTKPLPPNNHHKPAIITSINRNDATNALLAKIGPKKKGETPPIINIEARFKKYEIMLKIGVDLSGVLTQMIKDNMDKNMISEFEKTHGVKQKGNNDDDGINAMKLGLPSKPQIKAPKNSMKRFHWNPIKLDRIKNSIWNQVDQEWTDYDALNFELTFCQRTHKKQEKLNKNAMAKGLNEECIKKEYIVSFVSAKRSQQIQIGLRSYHMTNDELRQMILSMDDTKLDINDLIAMLDIIPSPEEQLIAEKTSQEKEIQHFGITERFFYSLYDIVELHGRFKKWIFKLQFEEKVNRLKEQITIIDRAKIKVFQSNNLKHIFSIILSWGNHMNFGNKLIGNCYGFHLNDLSLLPQIKTFDNSMTFPMFLYSFIELKQCNLLNIIHELNIIEKVANISVESVYKEYEALLEEMKELNAMITRYKEEYKNILSKNDVFLEEMEKFQQFARKEMWSLKFKYDILHKSEDQMIEYFVYDQDEENKKQYDITKIFQDLYAFLEMLRLSKVKLDELNKKRKRKKRSKSYKKRRKSIENVLYRRPSNLLSKNTASKMRFAIGFDDIGTPLVQQNKIKQVTFGAMISKLDDYKQEESKKTDFKFIIKPKIKKKELSTLSRSKSYHGSDEMEILKNKKQNIKKKPIPNKKPPKLNILNLMNSNSNLTPSDDKYHANVDIDHNHKKSVSKKSVSKKIPSKNLPSTPVKIKKKKINL